MRRDQLTTVTSYLADLTSRLSKLSSLQSPKHLDQLTREDSFIEENISKSYKKENEQNYLEYFQRVLNNPLTCLIKLKKPINQAFSLCEDLHILTSVSSRPNKPMQKVLQEMIKSKDVYKKNDKGQLIKRPFNKVIERYNFLRDNIQESQIKYIVKWIEKNGLQSKWYIEATSSVEEYQQTGLNIKIMAENNQLGNSNNFRGNVNKGYKNDKNNKNMGYQDQKINKRVNPTPKNNNTSNNFHNQQEQQEELINNLSLSKKKRKLQSQQKQKQNNLLSNNNKNRLDEITANIFKTPEQKRKTQLIQPNAPKRQLKYQSPLQERQKRQSINNINNINNNRHAMLQNRRSLRQRKFIRVIDSNKDVIIKQQQQQQEQQQQKIDMNKLEINKSTLMKQLSDNYQQLKIKIQTPKVSQFQLHPLDNNDDQIDVKNVKNKINRYEQVKSQQQSQQQQSQCYQNQDQEQQIEQKQQEQKSTENNNNNNNNINTKKQNRRIVISSNKNTLQLPKHKDNYLKQQQQLHKDNNQRQQQQQQQQQQCAKLQSILRQFEQKTKYNKIRILKYLDQLSGDLEDLRQYLQTENRELLWKRLEDAVLRKYVKQKINTNSNSNTNNGLQLNSSSTAKTQTTKLQHMYKQVLKRKGLARVNKRINYLNLLLVNTNQQQQ